MHLATYKPPKEELAFHSELLLDLQKLYNLSDQELLKQSFFKVRYLYSKMGLSRSRLKRFWSKCHGAR